MLNPNLTPAQQAWVTSVNTPSNRMEWAIKLAAGILANPDEIRDETAVATAVNDQIDALLNSIAEFVQG